MDQDKTFLGTEPVGKLLLKLAVPTVIAQLVNMLYNIVDRIYIGHMPGDGSLALTGVGVCMPIILVVSAFASFSATGGAPRASIFMGRGDHDSAEKTLGGCFMLQLGISAVLTAALLIWGRGLLLAFGASENTIGYAADYMNIYALGTVFVQLTLGMNAFITAQGFASIGMYTVLIGAVTNIVLDPVFIFALGMGVRGAALATVISQCLSCVWVLAFLRGKKTMLTLRAENLFPGAKLVLPCVALGAASFVMQASESVISVCFNSSLLKYGGDIAVGAMTILTSVMQLAMLPLQGIAQGAQPILSYNYGALRRARQEHVPAAAAGLPVLLDNAVGAGTALPRTLCGYVLLGRGAYPVHEKGAAHILRRAVHVRDTDSLPDDLRLDRLRGLLDNRGGDAQVRTAAAADIHHAAVHRGQDDRRIYCRACCGHYRGLLHGGDVLH